MSFPRKLESIISATYKFLDSRFRGHDNYLRMHQICWFAKKSELHPHLNSNPEIDQTQRQLGTASFQQQVEF